MTSIDQKTKDTLDNTSGALFGVALLQFVIAIALWNTYGWEVLPWSQRVIMFSGLIYLALSLVAKKQPVPAALVGVGLFGVYVAIQVAVNPLWILQGWLWKGLISLFLLLALVFALKGRYSRQEVSVP